MSCSIMFCYPIEVTDVFISEPINGIYYIAERSKKGRKEYLWSAMPVKPVEGPTRVLLSEVPRQVRKAAYRMFWNDGSREKRNADFQRA